MIQRGMEPAGMAQPQRKAEPFLPWSPGQAIAASRLQAMQDAISDINKRDGAGNIEQGYGRQNRPLLLFVADETKERSDTIVKAVRIGTNGERQYEAEQFPKGEWYRIRKGDLCAFIIQMTGEAVLYPVDPVRHLVFQQGWDADEGSLDMPSNGKSFFPTHIDDDLKVVGCHIYCTSGTYSVALTIGGTVQADTFTNSTTYPFEMSSPYKIAAGQAVGLKVNSSSSAKDFEAIFFLRKGYINTIGVEQ